MPALTDKTYRFDATGDEFIAMTKPGLKAKTVDVFVTDEQFRRWQADGWIDGTGPDEVGDGSPASDWVPLESGGLRRITDWEISPVGGDVLVIDEGGDIPTNTISADDFYRLDEAEQDRLRDLATMGEGHDCLYHADDYQDPPTCALCGLVLERAGDALVMPD